MKSESQQSKQHGRNRVPDRSELTFYRQNPILSESIENTTNLQSSICVTFGETRSALKLPAADKVDA